MPAKSAEQYGAMAAAAEGHSALGIPASIGKEFVKKTSPEDRSHFARALASKKKKKKNAGN